MSRRARVRRFPATVIRLALVALGGALGSVLRYLVTMAAVTWMGPTFPWGTLAVNLVGSFLIGLVQSLAVESLVISEEARLFLATGVMGGLTTYSAFSYETVRLAETGAWTRGLTSSHNRRLPRPLPARPDHRPHPPRPALDKRNREASASPSAMSRGSLAQAEGRPGSAGCPERWGYVGHFVAPQQERMTEGRPGGAVAP